MPFIIHYSQYCFLASKDILHNILNAQMDIEFANATKQEMVMLELDIENAYMTILIGHLYIIGKASLSYVMLDGGVTQPI